MARTVLFAEVPGFYAAVERVEDPSLAARPVIVGGDPRKRGRVQAATSDALEAGVRVDMPMLEALQCCPQARAVRTNMRHYRETSRRLLIALRGVHAQLEPFGLAAAYAEFSRAASAVEAVAAAMHAVVRPCRSEESPAHRSSTSVPARECRRSTCSIRSVWPAGYCSAVT